MHRKWFQQIAFVEAQEYPVNRALVTFERDCLLLLQVRLTLSDLGLFLFRTAKIVLVH